MSMVPRMAAMPVAVTMMHAAMHRRAHLPAVTVGRAMHARRAAPVDRAVPASMIGRSARQRGESDDERGGGAAQD